LNPGTPNTRVAVEIVKIFYESKDWEGVNSHIVLLAKRRQQLKQVASLSIHFWLGPSYTGLSPQNF